ncbi:MAG TPA: MFS transporter [Gemmataceae bacterium]|jgi:sugar phosphate permease|nr:MFS transporter [Gemmataceae bacterium]
MSAAETTPIPALGNNLPSPASHVRYQVLAVACSLALLTYVHRLGFVVGNNDIKDGLGLDKQQMGWLASAFLIAYATFQVPVGLLGDRLGGRHLLTLLVLGWSLLTGAVALAAVLPGPPVVALLFLLGIRFLFGMFQAGGFPILARVLADWMPLRERASAQGMTWTFSRLGGAFVPFLFLLLFQLFGTWTTPFWIMGSLGILWSAAFWPWFRNRPEEMKGVNAAERELIVSGRTVTVGVRGPVPWAEMLGSVSVWSLSLMYGFVGFAGNFITNLLPLYLGQERGLTREATMGLSAVPLACGAVSCVLGGAVSDRCVRRWGRKWGRRLVGMVGVACAGLALLFTLWVEELWLLALLLGASFFCNDLMMGPAWAACADIGERYAGTLSGGMNMLGSLAGAAGTYFAGHYFQSGHADLVFIVFACSYGLAALCWMGVNAARPLLASSGSPAPEAKSLAVDPCLEV